MASQMVVERATLQDRLPVDSGGGGWIGVDFPFPRICGLAASGPQPRRFDL